MSPPKKGKSKSGPNPKSLASASHVDDEVEKSARETNNAVKTFYNNSKVRDASLESYINRAREKYADLLQDIFHRMKSGLNVNPHEDLATIYEWKAIIGYHRLHNDVCYTDAFIAHVLRDGVKIAKNDALYYPILAEKFLKDGELGDAIECYKLAGDDCHKERLHELEQQLKEAEKQRKEAYDYIMRETRKEEAKKKAGKPRKKAKACTAKVEVVEKTTEVESHRTMSSPKLRDPIEPEAKRLRFTYEFCGVGGATIMDGSVEHSGKKVGVSLIKATHIQIHRVDELNQLCSGHKNLVKIFHLASEDLSNDEPFLMTEQVCSIEKYFEKEYVGLRGPDRITNQIWWDYIQQKFQLIFGGVIQGLIYLYRSGKACGDLSFSTFVTTQSGEGRILPSLDPAMNPKQMVKYDIKQLIQVMKSVIMLAHAKGGQKNENFVVKLPMELVHFFHFFTTEEMKIVHGFFWIDHPYFWTTVERVAFPYRLHRVVKRENLRRAIEKAITEFTDVYLRWWQILEGPYRELYRKSQSDPEGLSEELQSQQALPRGYIKLGSYETSVDIIRFYNAVYTHIKDSEYRIDKKVVLSDAKIEADLSNFYPKFYTDMFEAICRYVWQNGEKFDSTILREISNFRFSDSEYKTELNTEEWLG
ncbi:hypothetical protein OROGR_023337 [Orobanche gracilis]